MRQVGLGHHHEAGGVPVEAVHDAGAALGAARERGAAGHQRVHQRVVPVARRRMHHQAGRLVDHREVLVLEDDVERERIGDEGAGRLVLGEDDFDQVPVFGDARGADHFAVDPHRAGGDDPRGLGSREGKLVGEKAVDTLGVTAAIEKVTGGSGGSGGRRIDGPGPARVFEPE